MLPGPTPPGGVAPEGGYAPGGVAPAPESSPPSLQDNIITLLGRTRLWGMSSLVTLGTYCVAFENIGQVHSYGVLFWNHLLHSSYTIQIYNPISLYQLILFSQFLHYHVFFYVILHMILYFVYILFYIIIYDPVLSYMIIYFEYYFYILCDIVYFCVYYPLLFV